MARLHEKIKWVRFQFFATFPNRVLNQKRRPKRRRFDLDMT